MRKGRAYPLWPVTFGMASVTLTLRAVFIDFSLSSHNQDIIKSGLSYNLALPGYRPFFDDGACLNCGPVSDPCSEFP